MIRVILTVALGTICFAAGVRGAVREARFKDGTVRLRVELNEKGRPDGAYVAYHKNGVVRTRGLFVNGKRRGLWIFADERGYICGYEELTASGMIHSVAVR